MNRLHLSVLMAIFAPLVVLLTLEPASTQEVGLVPLNTKDVAKGYPASTLKTKSVLNDKGEIIGH